MYAANDLTNLVIDLIILHADWDGTMYSASFTFSGCPLHLYLLRIILLLLVSTGKVLEYGFPKYFK